MTATVRVHPTPRTAATIRVASVPTGHVYVQHLSDPDGRDAVIRLPDPPPPATDAEPGQWWPPAALSARWVRDHQHEFDVFHVQFGFDAQDPAELASVVDELGRLGKPLVYTVHDLRNPHHASRHAHDAHLDVLIPRAQALITLTEGAADAVLAGWGRRPVVLPHPHIVDLDRIRPRERNGATFVVGVHAKSVRASMDPLAVIAALNRSVAELADGRLKVNIHHDVFDSDGARFDPVLAEYLHRAASHGEIELQVHDCFTDEELWDYLAGLDVSVLPYRFGTHSGWLEACYDLGTTVLAPTCGFYREQRRCLSYRHDESGLDEQSLRLALASAYEQRPLWQATRAERALERRSVARAHRAIYETVLSR
ncbi:MAG: hypothetical protein DLM57_13490 [Pseudonocardiales bacterium]|nr:MAG: hypothetical protein DLM57_13490 [Pseudonocardiales bacterium]